MPSLFRILNLCWATLMTSVVVMLCVLHLPDPPMVSVAGVVFWLIYLVIALGVFFDLRVAWFLCILQLLSIWMLMGLAVSERSFGFITGQYVDARSPGTIAFVVFNSFFGVLVPASLLLVVLLLSRAHLHWLFSHQSRPLQHVIRGRKAALRRARRDVKRWRNAA